MQIKAANQLLVMVGIQAEYDVGVERYVVVQALKIMRKDLTFWGGRKDVAW